MKRIKKQFINLYCFVYYVVNIFFYKKNHVTNYFAPSSIVANKSKISIGRKFIFRGSGQLRGPFECGDHVRFGIGCHVFGGVTMGSHIMIAPNCVLTGGGHGTKLGDGPMIFQKCPPHTEIIIGSDVWIGANSVILPGVKIESGSIIAAGSVVTKDVLSNTIVGGNPAKLIKVRK